MAEKIIGVFDRSLTRVKLPSMSMAEFSRLLIEIKRQREAARASA